MWANCDWVEIHPFTHGAEQKLLYPGKISPRRFDELCDFVIKEYFTKPNYWKIDGKAYFSVYDVQKFVEGFGSVDATRAAMNCMREKAVAAGTQVRNIECAIYVRRHAQFLRKADIAVRAAGRPGGFG